MSRSRPWRQLRAALPAVLLCSAVWHCAATSDVCLDALLHSGWHCDGVTEARSDFGGDGSVDTNPLRLHVVHPSSEDVIGTVGE